jgi:hypothetical protein
MPIAQHCRRYRTEKMKFGLTANAMIAGIVRLNSSSGSYVGDHHINALPFFAPLYVQGNEFEICGARHSDLGVEALIGPPQRALPSNSAPSRWRCVSA